MFNKEGFLERVGIQGTDANGQNIEDSWLHDECYAIGQSFTGKAVLQKEDGYGEIRWTNDLRGNLLDENNKNEYLRKLGELNCAIACPLNGQNRSYGVLRVINKVDPETRKSIQYGTFSKEEIRWLSTVSSSISYLISNYRRDRQSKLYMDLSSFLIGSPADGLNPKLIYREITRRLISSETAFKVCILRKKNEDSGTLQVVAKSGTRQI